MPVHLPAMALSVQHAIAASDFGPDDVAIVNDSFRGGTHLGDNIAIAGVFLKAAKRRSSYLANAHTNLKLSDVAGPEGTAREDVLDLIRADVRTPDERSPGVRRDFARRRCYGPLRVARNTERRDNLAGRGFRRRTKPNHESDMEAGERRGSSPRAAVAGDRLSRKGKMECRL